MKRSNQMLFFVAVVLIAAAITVFIVQYWKNPNTFLLPSSGADINMDRRTDEAEEREEAEERVEGDTETVPEQNGGINTPSGTLSDLEQKILNSAVYFPVDYLHLPDEMLVNFKDKKGVIIGETHYVQEHHQFLKILIQDLYKNGLRVVMLEEMQAKNHLLNLFVHNPELKLNNYDLGPYSDILIFIKEMNQKFMQQNRETVSVLAFDINHVKSAYRASVLSLVQYYNLNGEIAEMASSIDPEALTYMDEIRGMSSLIEADLSIPPEIATILLDMTAKELRTLEIKQSWSNNKSTMDREVFIYNEIQQGFAHLQENDLALVNIGIWHAQKNNQWDLGEPGLKTAAQLLNQDYGDQLYHFFVIGLKGERKPYLRASDRIQVNMVQNNQPDNIVKTLGKNSMNSKNSVNRNIFVNFQDEGYTEELSIGFYNDVISIQPEEIIDGILLYPEINIAESSKIFEIH